MKPGSASSIELTIPHVNITIKNAANSQHIILTGKKAPMKLAC
jgi:ATP:corrinoid adenosyltransferase